MGANDASLIQQENYNIEQKSMQLLNQPRIILSNIKNKCKVIYQIFVVFLIK